MYLIVKMVFFLKDFIYFIFTQRGREGERGGEKHQCVVASPMPPTGNLACNPGLCPDWESNQQPFGSQPTLNTLNYTSQGLKMIFLCYMYLPQLKKKTFNHT